MRVKLEEVKRLMPKKYSIKKIMVIIVISIIFSCIFILGITAKEYDDETGYDSSISNLNGTILYFSSTRQSVIIDTNTKSLNYTIGVLEDIGYTFLQEFKTYLIYMKE